jgi:diguanylate cyclase (GGDEF)-like protein/PAS domain S-box-containing protein
MASVPPEFPSNCPLALKSTHQEQHCAHWAISNLPIAVYRCQVSSSWTMTALTEGIQILTGYPADSLLSEKKTSFEDLIYPEDRDRVRQEMLAALQENRPYAVEYRYFTASQELRWMSDQGQGCWDETGQLNYLDGILMDVTGHKQAEEQLQLLWSACEQSPASIVITDNLGNISYVNPKFESVTGYSAAEARGKNPKILKTGHTPPEQYRQLWTTITRGGTWTGEFLNRKKNGDYFWETASISPVKDLNGQITHFVAVKEDITAHKETAEMLSYQAHYDALTDLPNRALAIDHLKLAISQAEREREYVAILLIDLDDFKAVNESIGHDAGDQLLCQVAERFKQHIQPGDTLARWGGDEFLLILQGLKDLEQVLPLGHQLLDVVEQPFLLDGTECYTSASIGVAIYPLDSQSSTILLRNADIALYNAKQAGRKNIKCFESGMNLRAQRHHQVVNQLRRALEFKEFTLVFQPLVDLKRGCISGAEALLRWYNPVLGEISPVEFIPIAEETGLILSIGDWVIENACQQLHQWRHYLDDRFSLAINLSSRQFRVGDLADRVADHLQRYKIPAHQLELEITESLLLDDQPTTQALMRQFKAMGLRLSIDDFGTGYSALSYLRRFSLDILKIDRSFISGLPQDQDLKAMVKAIIFMAHELNLAVIAEGIETEAQLKFLEAQNCDYGQGFWFSYALPPQEFFNYALQGMVCRACTPIKK